MCSRLPLLSEVPDVTDPYDATVPTYQLTYPPAYVPTCLSDNLYKTYVSVCLSICQVSISLAVCIFYLSTCLYILSVCLFIHYTPHTSAFFIYISFVVREL